MIKYFLSLMLFLSFIVIFSSCRPKDLEGAFLEYKNGRFDKAFVLAEKATKEHPNNPEAWYLLGVLYGKKDNIPEMADAFDKSLAIDASQKSNIEDEKYSYYASKFNSGAKNYNAYLQAADKQDEKMKDKLKQAIKDFRDSNLMQHDFRAYNLTAYIYSLLGDLDQAESAYKTLTDVYPDSASSWLSFHHFYFDNKKYEEALPVINKALEIDNDNSEAWSSLAQTYDMLEQTDKAIETYKKATELNPSDSSIPFNLGLLYYKLGNVKDISEEDKIEKLTESIKFMSLSIELNPDYQSSYQLKGNAELLLQQNDAAMETLEQGVELFPDDKQMWNDLGVCYSRKGMKEKAEMAFQRADEL